MLVCFSRTGRVRSSFRQNKRVATTPMGGSKARAPVDGCCENGCGGMNSWISQHVWVIVKSAIARHKPCLDGSCLKAQRPTQVVRPLASTYTLVPQHSGRLLTEMWLISASSRWKAKQVQASPYRPWLHRLGRTKKKIVWVVHKRQSYRLTPSSRGFTTSARRAAELTSEHHDGDNGEEDVGKASASSARTMGASGNWILVRFLKMCNSGWIPT